MTTTSPRLERVWESDFRLAAILGTVDHKKIGIRYMLATCVFFLLGGLEALLIRVQLAVPENDFVSPDTYNQAFTMHGTKMIFLVVMPLLTGGFGNYLIPLMIGARDMAFPRLNALSFWIFLLAGSFMYSGFLLGSGPAGGWFAYVPLTSSEYLPGKGMDFWALGLTFLSISTTAGAVNFIVTIFSMRAPGMSLNRMPLFVWAILATAFAIIFALPALTLDAILLELDRQFGTHFFDPQMGGSPLLWQHLFWVFGHPDVYIMFLPAVGIVSSIITVYSQRPVVGYTWLALATVAIAFVGFGVWVHHMFAVGLPLLPTSFFAAASIVIVVPSGVQVFAWLATVWTGRPRLDPPMMYVLGFIAVFVAGGITGVMVAAIPLDWQVHDSYFVVAHFHYVLVGSAMFAILGGFSHWLPKITGRMLHRKTDYLAFWTIFTGFNITFFPMHILGLLGMPRRVYTYQEGLGWDGLNMLVTAGSFLLTAGLVVFTANVARALKWGPPAGANPWNGDSLEWATSSPPEAYNFASVPVVRSGNPLWNIPSSETADNASEAGDYLEDVHDSQRQTLKTTPLDANPERISVMPGDSFVPLLLAVSLAVFFIGFLNDIVVAWSIGAALAACSIALWTWPTRKEWRT